MYSSRLFLFFALLTLLIASCNRKDEITIKGYSHKGETTYVYSDEEPGISISSEVSIHLLSTESSDPHEQKIVDNINRSILRRTDYISLGNKKYRTGQDICRSLVSYYLSDMQEEAAYRYEDYQRPIHPDDEILEEENPFIINYYTNVTTDCYLGKGDSIVCYKYERTRYNGGAHPSIDSFALSYSKIDGSIIDTHTLFAKNSLGELEKRIINKLSEMGIPSTQITISNNILLNKDDIVFHYGTYDIAEYAAGEIDIHFRYDELSDILQFDI